MARFQDEILGDALGRLSWAAWRMGFARRMGVLLPGAICLAGAWVLLARFGLGASRLDALWGLGLLALAPLFSALLARRGVPDQGTLVAWLDQRAGGTGEVLTQFELGDPRWERAAARVCLEGEKQELPGMRFRTAGWGSLPAGLFVVLAIWFTPPVPAASLPTGLFDRVLERLAEEVATLVEQGLEEEGAELVERLAQLAKGLGESSLEQSFEALDRFQEDLEQLAARHAESLAALREVALAAAADGAAGELGQALEQLLADPEMQALGQSLLEQFEGLNGLSSLSPMDLAQLGGMLSEELAGQLADLASEGLIDQAALERALARREIPRSLKEALMEHAPDCESRSGGL